jgi:hypothetical protein
MAGTGCVLAPCQSTRRPATLPCPSTNHGSPRTTLPDRQIHGRPAAGASAARLGRRWSCRPRPRASSSARSAAARPTRSLLLAALVVLLPAPRSLKGTHVDRRGAPSGGLEQGRSSMEKARPWSSTRWSRGGHPWRRDAAAVAVAGEERIQPEVTGA